MVQIASEMALTEVDRDKVGVRALVVRADASRERQFIRVANASGSGRPRSRVCTEQAKRDGNFVASFFELNSWTTRICAPTEWIDRAQITSAALCCPAAPSGRILPFWRGDHLPVRPCTLLPLLALRPENVTKELSAAEHAVPACFCFIATSRSMDDLQGSSAPGRRTIGRASWGIALMRRARELGSSCAMFATRACEARSNPHRRGRLCSPDGDLEATHLRRDMRTDRCGQARQLIEAVLPLFQGVTIS